jgi:tRNA-(ms[2]io[6]A)-hydroxylase
VLKNFNTFLIDHAACERKASATGINFVVRFHDRPHLIDTMIRFSREELYHFHQVSKLALKRGLKLAADEKNIYINALLQQIRNGREEQLLDRLIVFGITEARGHERFGLVAKFMTDPDLKDFYAKLTAAEEGHSALFLKLAYFYFKPSLVNDRLNELLDFEATLVKSLPLRVAVH